MGDDDPHPVVPNYSPFSIPDEGPFVVRAFITKDDTLKPGRFSERHEFKFIYQGSPASARYAVLTYKGRVKVVDLYESEVVVSPTPRVIPKWVEGNWVGVHHAIAHMRISYDMSGSSWTLASGRITLNRYIAEHEGKEKQKQFNQAFDNLAK